jgi:putative alpha-1,2-mannosidase
VYVANAYAFGARDFDTAAALDALDGGASAPGSQSGGHPVREWLEPWLSLGYVPDQPSISLEYAADDFGIAQLAGFLGQTARRDAYLRRAANWVNTFNPLTGFVEPRDSSGQFTQPEHNQQCCGFVEGNAAQYTLMVPFDYAGLIDRLGGPAAAVARLDDFFADVNAPCLDGQRAGSQYALGIQLCRGAPEDAGGRAAHSAGVVHRRPIGPARQ